MITTHEIEHEKLGLDGRIKKIAIRNCGIPSDTDLRPYLTIANANATYLRLDCTNDPLTGTLLHDVDNATETNLIHLDLDYNINTPLTANRIFYGIREYLDTNCLGNFNSTLRGIWSESTINDPAKGSVTGAYIKAYLNSNTAGQGSLRGAQIAAAVSGSAAPSDIYGVWFAGFIENGSTAEVPNAYGIRALIDNENVGAGGHFNNAYCIYAEHYLDNAGATPTEVLYGFYGSLANATTIWGVKIVGDQKSEIDGYLTALNYISDVATGTQPYACTSTTENTNLNAQLWGGNDSNATVVQGDLLYGSGAAVVSNLAKSIIANQYLKNSGVNNNPAWATIAVGDLPTFDLSGTTNQVNLSVSGADVLLSRDLTLSLPQDIHTTATPQFLRLGLGQAATAVDSIGITNSLTTNNSTIIYGQKTGAVVGTSYGGYMSVNGNSTTNVGYYATTANANTNICFYADASITEGTASSNLAYAFVANTGDISVTTNKILWGTLGSEDTNLYRNAANVLKTDDAFIAAQFTSTIATGTSPYACTSTTLNTNLNADAVDNLHAQTLTATSPITLSAATSVLASAGITIAHATTAGNIHLPTGGTLNQILKNNGTSGTGAWGTVTENNGALAAITTISMSSQLTNTLAIGTAPFVITSTTKVSNLNVDYVDSVHVAALTNTRLLRYNSTGTQIENATVTESSGALGGITTISMSGQLTSTLAIGTSPFAVTSTTVNTNLNADLWDGYQFADYLDQAVKTTSSPQFANVIITAGGDIKPSANSTTAINIAQADGTNFVTFDTTNTRVGINTTPSHYLHIAETVNSSAVYGVNSTISASILQDLSANTGQDEALDNTYEAIKFTATDNHTVGSVTVRLKVDIALTNPSAYLTIYLRADNAGVPAGTNLATGSNIYYGSITTSYASYKVAMSETLVSGNSYWVVIKRSAAPTGGTIYMDSKASGSATHAYSATGGAAAWTTEDNKDGYTIIYGKAAYAGYFSSVDAYGLYAISTNNCAIRGTSTFSYGGYFTSTHSMGVYASSVNNFGLGAYSTNGIAGYFQINPATTTTVDEVIRIARLTTGSAGIGEGGTLNFYMEDSNGTSELMGRFGYVATAVASTHETADLIWYTRNDGAAAAEKLRLTGPGNLCLGTTDSDATATKTLTIKNGTAPGGHVDNQIQIYSNDSSDNTATLCLYLEQAVEAIGTFTASDKIKVKINGTEYWIQLDAV